jgi:uncharacterized protein
MDTLLNNKRIINGVLVLIVTLSAFTFVKFINEIKKGQYIGSNIPATNVINVSGTGEVKAIPDIATISFTLTKDASTAKESQSSLNTQVEKVLAFIKTKDIKDADVKSEYGGINPKYTSTTINCFAYPCPQPESKITGYTATQSISIKVRAVDTANDVRTGLANLGVTNISGPTFGIDDETLLQEQARDKAIKNAQEKAEKLAKSLGVKIVRVAGFSENGGNYPMMYSKDMMANSLTSGSAPAPTLPKGENTISSTVNITYEIR